MAKKPFFSIIIPTYNRAANLQFALYCIFQQTFRDFEIVISDNCSTDDTKAVVNELRNKKITYLRNKKNVVYALNAKNAIKHAKGKYIFLHSDDDFLFDKNSLSKIYAKIKKYNPGYVRAIYICISSDKKRIFNFRINNPFVNNMYLTSLSENNSVLSFILNTDHYFITGTIFKNDLPKNIKILTSEHAPWMEILFYVTQKYGAYFIAEPCIAALWSTWRNKKDGSHPVYNLINGKLEAENYFNMVRKKISKQEYGKFLHTQLMGIYVRLFPLIKVLVGNKNLLQFSSRIRTLDPTIEKGARYWVYLFFALTLPRTVIKIIRDIYLFLYIHFSEVENKKIYITKLKKLEQSYIDSNFNIKKKQKRLFKF